MKLFLKIWGLDKRYLPAQAEREDGWADADFLKRFGVKWGTEAHVELTVSQVKHNTARLIAPVSAAERRQDAALCFTGDLKRHVEGAASESPCCCSCWTFWQLLESVFLGYCPLLRFVLLPFILLYCMVAWFKVKRAMLREGKRTVSDPDYWKEEEKSVPAEGVLQQPLLAASSNEPASEPAAVQG